MIERFTFIVITPKMHFTQECYLDTKRAADQFDILIYQYPEADCIAYYGASAGGQVNSYVRT